jgi:hypothetical protein
MRQNGYPVEVGDDQSSAAAEARSRVPAELRSCHTAIVDGYIIEGHVPVAEIERLLVERPDVLGLAIQGMPIGSPGMEVDGATAEAFDVLAFAGPGQVSVFASYGG